MIAVTWVPGSNPHSSRPVRWHPSGTIPSRWRGHVRLRRAAGSGCPPRSRRGSRPSVPACRLAAAPTTRVAGVRRYLPSRLGHLLRRVAVRGDGVGDACRPSRARPSPSTSANRHGQVRLWFGAHIASSHSAATSLRGTSTIAVHRHAGAARADQLGDVVGVHPTIMPGGCGCAPRRGRPSCRHSCGG